MAAQWTLSILSLPDHQLRYGPEIFDEGYLAYRRANTMIKDTQLLALWPDVPVVHGKFGLAMVISAELDNAKGKIVPFMERRALLCHDANGAARLEWHNRPSDEKPFRVTIRADDTGYAWDEYGMVWYVDTAFAGPEAEALDQAFMDWLRIFQSMELDSDGRVIVHFDWAEYHATGLALAKRLKQLAGDDVVLCYERPYEDVLIVESLCLIE